MDHTSWATMNDDGDTVTVMADGGAVELWDADKHELIGKPFQVGKRLITHFPVALGNNILWGQQLV